MTTGESRNGIDPAAFVELHNELADELNAAKNQLNELKSRLGQQGEDLETSPLVNYAQGKVIGFDIAVNALHAFAVAHAADVAGQLEPHQA